MSMAAKSSGVCTGRSACGLLIVDLASDPALDVSGNHIPAGLHRQEVSVSRVLPAARAVLRCQGPGDARSDEAILQATADEHRAPDAPLIDAHRPERQVTRGAATVRDE